MSTHGLEPDDEARAWHEAAIARGLLPRWSEHRWAAVAGAGDVDGRLRALGDDAVEVGVEEVEPGRGTPVPEQAMLDVVARQRLAQQGVVKQVDLPDRQVVGGAPPTVDRLESRVGELGSGGGLPGGRGADVEGHASILVVRHER